MDYDAAPAQMLRAGPLTLKFADGELRYLHAGGREIVRRIYFAVRDHRWDTAMPRFSVLRVEKGGDSFEIELAADCRTATADYSWRGRITGTAEGVLTFEADGVANRDFGSNRIGLCVLFGSDSLAGQAFATAGESGERAGEFPRLVAPALVAEKFRELRYTTASGVTVCARMSGAVFDMEDQRNYGDSSFKAYAPLPYAYPAVAAGSSASQILRLAVEGAARAPLGAAETRVRIGGIIAGARIPKLAETAPGTREVDFFAVNTHRAAHAAVRRLQFAFNPALHLPDDDTFMENPSALPDMVRTARIIAPGAAIRIDPITFDSQHPRPARDPRNASQFGAVWSALVVKYLALAGVGEAAFAIDGEPARAVLRELAAFAGCAVRETVVAAEGRAPVEALAIDDGPGVRLWLMNTTDLPQRVLLADGDVFTPLELAPHEIWRGNRVR